MNELSALLRQDEPRPVGGGPTLNTDSFVTHNRPWMNAQQASSGQNQQQGSSSNLSSMLRNGQKLYNAYNTSAPSGSLYESGSGLSTAGMGTVGTEGSSMGTLYGTGSGLSTAGLGTVGAGEGGATGTLYGTGSGLSLGAGAEAGGGALGGSTGGGAVGAGGAGSGIYSFWPAAVAAIAYENEKSARSEGARDPNRGHYIKDVFSGNVINQDMKNRWGPTVTDAFGNGTWSKGSSQDIQGIGQLGSGDIRGWAGNLHNGAVPKAMSGLVKMLRF